MSGMSSNDSRGWYSRPSGSHRLPHCSPFRGAIINKPAFCPEFKALPTDRSGATSEEKKLLTAHEACSAQNSSAAV